MKDVDKLITDNHSLIYSFLIKYGLDFEEWYDVAAIGLVIAAKNYDESKGAFSTMAYKCMFNEIGKSMRKFSAMKRQCDMVVSLDNEIFDDLRGIDLMTNSISSEDEALLKVTLEEFRNTLDDKHLRVFDLICEGYKQREIVAIVGCSQALVSRLKSKFKKFMEV